MSMPGGDFTTFHLVCHGEARVHMPGDMPPVAMRADACARQMKIHLLER